MISTLSSLMRPPRDPWCWAGSLAPSAGRDSSEPPFPRSRRSRRQFQQDSAEPEKHCSRTPQLVCIPVTLLPLTSGLDADMLWFTHDDLADALLCCTEQPPPTNTYHRHSPLAIASLPPCIAPKICRRAVRASTARIPTSLSRSRSAFDQTTTITDENTQEWSLRPTRD